MSTYCANENCIRHTDYSGGRFRYSPQDSLWYCEECYATRYMGEPGKNLWDFVTSHGDGQRTHIRSLKELRAYEKRTGTSNQLANYREANCK